MAIAFRCRISLVTLLSVLLCQVGLQGVGIPDKIVVLTFDDSIKSHHTVVAPLLKRYGFGATFFITEGFEFKTDKTNYLTWEEIASLHRDGFEIGNHTRDHMGVTEKSLPRLGEQVEAINRRCAEYGIPRPISFAYPGNALVDGAAEALKELGFTFARRGGAPEHPYEHGRGFAYEPGLDHPLLIPTAGDARPHWTLEDFKGAVHQAKMGKIAVLQFHGVPDRAHAWVHTPKERFEEYMAYLAANDYTVIALRDLQRYVDPMIAPNNWEEVINDRKSMLAQGDAPVTHRRPETEGELRYWLSNMVVDHGYDEWEVRAATGLPLSEIREAVARLGLTNGKATPRAHNELAIRPYPGGRHPRIGFLDGAMRPQRETKFSVFAPWEGGGYAVVDVPEAIWVNRTEGRELLYLAHTHVPTLWSKRQMTLAPLEWQVEGEHSLSVERRLPNNITFGARVRVDAELVRMELWLENGSEQTLTGLNVQNCVMLRELAGFNQLSNDNKVMASPYSAAHDETRRRWVITAWEHCRRPWANPNCPCLHADPQFPDCPPGESRRLRGLVTFFSGENVEGEFKRLDPLWRGERSSQSD